MEAPFITLPSAAERQRRTTVIGLFLPLTGERKPVPFIHSQFNETFGQLSPEGRWLAYTSNESGRGEVYVVPVPGPGGKRPARTAVEVCPAGGATARNSFIWMGHHPAS